jgi:hypothetical protein
MYAHKVLRGIHYSSCATHDEDICMLEVRDMGLA